ncbi:MAG TPA: hypothetical protein VGD39_19010 [Nocardioides sp.]
MAASAKARLVGQDGVLRTLPGLADVTVEYDMPATVPREVVYGGDFAGAVALAAFKGSAPSRILRQGDIALQLHVRVSAPGQTTREATDTRAAEIATVIEEYVAGNPTLDDLSGLKLAEVQAVESGGWIDDDGATSTLTIQIGLKSVVR